MTCGMDRVVCPRRELCWQTHLERQFRLEAEQALQKVVGRLTYNTCSWEQVAARVATDRMGSARELNNVLEKYGGQACDHIFDVQLLVLKGEARPPPSDVGECTMDSIANFFGTEYVEKITGRANLLSPLLTDAKKRVYAQFFAHESLEKAFNAVKEDALKSESTYLFEVERLTECTRSAWQSSVVLLSVRRCTEKIANVDVALAPDHKLFVRCTGLAGHELMNTCVDESITCGQLHERLRKHPLTHGCVLKVVVGSDILSDDRKGELLIDAWQKAHRGH